MLYPGETGPDTVLLPLNLTNSHWCCVVVEVNAKRIYYYDPLNQVPYLSAAKAIATHLKISGLNQFDVILQNNPIQFDAYSCGVFVCWMFIRQVVPGPSLDMNANSLARRRFELFYYLLKGRLLFMKTHGDIGNESEEKEPPPAQDEVSKEADEVPPTKSPSNCTQDSELVP
ncbi:hypothetical protein V7S43_013595 [Phytophthora oleae]|uniref:Ubiquitin-like protease family profile domain-containing protein n=1 Tax=Phytophthora oleae TaxID=2107226 RepID=A0ABD3F4I6_9STRA